MTRRVVMAIVINVWLVLIAAGCSTYFITRSLLLADLDETIVNRVALLRGIERPAAPAPAQPGEHDDYVIYKEGKLVTSLAEPGDPGPAPVVINRAFIKLPDGSRQRTLTLQAFAHRDGADSALVPVTVVYRASAAHVDALLRQLLYSLGFFAVLAAAATGVTAHFVARAALRPMRHTVEIIGRIDERSLNRRLDPAGLPTELAPMAVKLNDLLARLELAFAQRRQLLADASHELRTPVAALVTTLEVALRSRREPEDYVRLLNRCLTDAQLLHHLVVGLLERARAERFAENPEMGPVMLSELLQQCADTVEPLAQAGHIELVRRISGRMVVLSDEGLIRSAVVNLLSNAVEYTAPPGEGREGRVVLSARLREASADKLPEVLRTGPAAEAGVPAAAIIEVQDNGRGIDPAHLPHIFEPFYRVDTVRSGNGHLGLGLAVVQANVRALGGRCEAANVPGGGGLFRLELPTVSLAAWAGAEGQASDSRVPV
jgi:signal transduction histidine kinase